MLGLGPAGNAMLPYIESHPSLRLTAVCDSRSEALDDFKSKNVATCLSLEEMTAGETVDAVFVATPSWLHREHSVALLTSGKHVLVEKPMAISLAEADAMITAAGRSRRALIVGHSQSFEPAIQVMRAVVQSGRLGALRAINGLNYGDWMYRPRRPEEFERSRGGGVVYRQAAHHVDVVRYLAGEEPNILRAAVGDWCRDRPGDGSYSVLLQFPGGVVATLFYSGYDHFSSDELTFAINESGRRRALHRATARGTEPESAPRGEGSRDEAPEPDRRTELLRPGPFPSTFGLMVVSCERGDMRICPEGVRIYGHGEQYVIPTAGLPAGRAAVLDEFVDAIEGQRTTHDGNWGRANLELCLSILSSSDTCRQIEFAPSD
ncbi:MAG TPA: Gfo/Idh/MocA family oxidoreductase, partial [Bradyrhizobium sp.]|nr:Gfo/Idh/MocA family oxidoreductase [Bradyrhizobium sp.]